MLVDLDGVVRLGDQPIAAAAPALAAARSAGLAVAFVTNNAALSAEQVAASLDALGVPASPRDVVTSAAVAAAELARRLPAGSPVLVVGGTGLRESLVAAGLAPTVHAEGAAAVVQGWSDGVDWRQLAEAAVALQAGVPWIATNLDRTLPSPRGPLPGNGSLVAALATTTGRAPESVGKPKPAMFTGAADAIGSSRPLVVGDRLDTDIAGAVAAGQPALLVFSGVSTPADALAAPGSARPTYLGRDLTAVTYAHPQPVADGGLATCGTTTVHADGTVDSAEEHRGSDGSDGLDGLRAACALAWSGRLTPDRFPAVLTALALG